MASYCVQDGISTPIVLKGKILVGSEIEIWKFVQGEDARLNTEHRTILKQMPK